jgi:conjugative relaxase-like TrwC/TraI family protein
MKQYVRGHEAPDVLKLHVVHAGGHGYYLEGHRSGTDLELPGIWSGPAASALGLSGPVEPDRFDQVMGGNDPRSGTQLRQVRGPSGVEAFDLTFCAPKSVSLLHALAPGEILTEIVERMASAVDVAPLH